MSNITHIASSNDPNIQLWTLTKTEQGETVIGVIATVYKKGDSYSSKPLKGYTRTTLWQGTLEQYKTLGSVTPTTPVKPKRKKIKIR